MSLNRTYGVWCDGAQSLGDTHAEGCPKEIGHWPTSKDARAYAKRHGWKRIVARSRWDNRDLSPQCAAREGVSSS